MSESTKFHSFKLNRACEQALCLGKKIARKGKRMRGGGGESPFRKCQLSVKILVSCQLNVRLLVICQLNGY